MSRVLKRPMFRKGGEVMEGIMTGIKPREMFSEKGATDSTVQDIQNRINLIDAFSGTSPLSDPLTQFLLTSGPALVGGEAAGGTKLQEIIGGIKPGLDKATKMQQLKDLSRRKIASSVISKMGTGGLQKYIQQAKDAFRIDPELANQYEGNAEKYALELFNDARFRQSKSTADIQRDSLNAEADSIMKREYNKFQKGSYFIRSAAKDIAQAKRDLEKSPEFKDGEFNLGREMIVPDTFNIHYMYRGSDNTYLHKIGECVLETMSVQYGGDRYRTHGESSSELDVDGLPITGAPPVETTITLNFKELGMVDRKKVKEGF